MKTLVCLFIFLIYQTINVFAFTSADSAKSKWDSPIKLKHFVSGPLFGIQTYCI